MAADAVVPAAADAGAPPRTVQVSTGWHAAAPRAGTGGSSSAGGARPVAWLGAPAPGGLALPAAMPTAAQLYGPRGVWLDDAVLVVADTGNHRVLIWHDPSLILAGRGSHGPADVVLGQSDFVSEGAQAGGRGADRGMRLPSGVLVHDGRLVVADAWNHRLLVWDQVPSESGVAPDAVVGQPDQVSVEENRGGPCGPTSFYWPFGLAFIDGHLWVADTGNRRVLGFAGIPTPGQGPDVVLGQPDAASRDENRGELGPGSFRWPHDIAGTPDRLLVADAGNHRILGWAPAPEGDRPADGVLGQPDFVTAAEFPYAPQTATSLRFPYAIDIGPVSTRGGARDDTSVLAVADTANNRILLWDRVPVDSAIPADRVLGQPDFGGAGENRWDEVGNDTFCWPYGLRIHNGRLAVADSGNNRVMVWELG